MRSKVLQFWRPEYGEDIKCAESFEAKNFDCFEEMDANLEAAAESYSEHFHDNCDGWECSWPITFSIADSEDKFLGNVSVDRQSTPVFMGKIQK